MSDETQISWLLKEFLYLSAFGESVDLPHVGFDHGLLVLVQKARRTLSTLTETTVDTAMITHETQTHLRGSVHPSVIFFGGTRRSHVIMAERNSPRCFHRDGSLARAF